MDSGGGRAKTPQALGLHIAAVSYEGSLFGWDTVKTTPSDEKAGKQLPQHSSTPHPSLTDQEGSLVLKFGFHCSVGSLRAVAISKSGKYLVCGGMNERIQIFDLSINKSLGELSQHTGAITALEFYADSYLLSSGEDNAVCIWRVNDWTCVHILGGHKDIVHDLSVHNSGKLALSVSRDNTLKLWNLVEGRCAYTRRMKSTQPATQVSWNNSGDHYLLVTGCIVQIYAAADNSCTAKLIQSSRVNKAAFAPSLSKIKEDVSSMVGGSSGNNGGHILILCEDRSLHLYTTSGDKVSCVQFPEEMKRTRDMSVCRVNSKNEGDQYLYAVTVITSAGSVIVVNLAGMFDMTPTFESIYYSSYSLKVEPRLTCVTSWTNVGKKKNERKNKDGKKRKAVNKEENEIETTSDDKCTSTNTDGSKKKKKKKGKRVSFGENSTADEDAISFRKKNRSDSENCEQVGYRKREGDDDEKDDYTADVSISFSTKRKKRKENKKK